MSAAAFDIRDLLGGAQTMGSSSSDMRGAIRQGLPYATVTALAKSLGVDVGEVAKIIDLSERTHQRRKGRSLTSTESDRLVRLARLGAHAIRVFSDPLKAQAWLARPNAALGNERPLDMLDTDIGSTEVEAVLHRIEFGVFS